MREYATSIDGLLTPEQKAVVKYTHDWGGPPAGRRILTVDDEVQIVKLVEVNLRKTGYRTAPAYDGVEALAAMETLQPSPEMLVLDVMMPRMNGFDVVRRLQANPATEHIPVIMLTAKAQDKDVFEGYQAGVFTYLTKPFNPRELLVFTRRIFESIDAGPDAGIEGDVWEV